MVSSPTAKPALIMKCSILFAVTLVFRLITGIFPFAGLANVAPLTSAQQAASKSHGPLVASLFGALNIVLLDLMVGRTSTTLYTALSQVLVGMFGYYYLASRPPTSMSFLGAAAIGTLIYDGLTGLVFTPLQGDITFMEALVGQIVFTLKRSLPVNMLIAGFVSPWLYGWLSEKPAPANSRTAIFA